MAYQFVYEQNPETGEFGLRPLWLSFAEAAGSNVTAHDVLEHPPKGRESGSENELMALGAVLFGRLRLGFLNVDDLAHDVVAACTGRRALTAVRTHEIPEVEDDLKEIALCVALLTSNNPEWSGETTRRALGWIRRGYRWARRRYKDPIRLTYLFQKLGTEVKHFIQTEYLTEGKRVAVIVNRRTESCRFARRWR